MIQPLLVHPTNQEANHASAQIAPPLLDQTRQLIQLKYHQTTAPSSALTVQKAYPVPWFATDMKTAAMEATNLLNYAQLGFVNPRC